MGLLSLDVMTLKIMKEGGTPAERKRAGKILPLVERHHLLLVTLLLANAAAVEAMPVFLDRISNAITAILVSVTAVLIFGEYVLLCHGILLQIRIFDMHFAQVKDPVNLKKIDIDEYTITKTCPDTCTESSHFNNCN